MGRTWRRREGSPHGQAMEEKRGEGGVDRARAGGGWSGLDIPAHLHRARERQQGVEGGGGQEPVHGDRLQQAVTARRLVGSWLEVEKNAC